MNNVISTKCSIFRNLKDYKFANKLTDEQKLEISKKITPIFADKDKEVNVKLFDVEHLTIFKENAGFSLDCFNKTSELSTKLANSISLAYSDDYGYLMSDLSRIGSGIKLECNITLPSICNINKIDQVRRNIQNLGYSFTKTEQEKTYTISTTCTLGFSPKEIAKNFENVVAKIQELEIESEKMQEVELKDEMMDASLRSLAILKSAHMLKFDEFVKLLSNIITGANLGYIELTTNTLNKLKQTLTSENTEYTSITQMKELAEKVKKILKGETDV